jgi:hypothetical protein
MEFERGRTGFMKTTTTIVAARRSSLVRRAFALVLIPIAYGLFACSGQSGGEPPTSTTTPPGSPSPSSAGFTTVDTSWAGNPDNPDGYLVYIGASAGGATILVRTLAKGATDWNPNSPAAELDVNAVLAAVGAAKQVCVAIRAFNVGGVSLPSQVTCAILP